MAAQRHVRVDKLFNGFASVRDYKVTQAALAGEDLVIIHGEKAMLVPNQDLKNPAQLHKTVFKSKFGTGSYTLYDFKFIPNM